MSFQSLNQGWTYMSLQSSKGLKENETLNSGGMGKSGEQISNSWVWGRGGLEMGQGSRDFGCFSL